MKTPMHHPALHEVALVTRRKPRRGPCPAPRGAGRTAVPRVRVSPEEHAAYVADAERAGVLLSEWVREQLSFPHACWQVSAVRDRRCDRSQGNKG